MKIDEITNLLLSMQNEDNANGMQRFGIKGNLLGISVVELRKIAKQIKTDHSLALNLWQSPFHEAKLLATMIADKQQMTSKEMDCWVKDFYGWDIVDQACSNIFKYLSFSQDKVFEYAKSDEEYVRRTAFSLIATMTFNKKIPDSKFEEYLPLIEKYSFDERNFVWKAVDWALRSIGKRDMYLHDKALQEADALLLLNNKNSKKIGRISQKELLDEKTILRIKTKEKK